MIGAKVPKTGDERAGLDFEDLPATGGKRRGIVWDEGMSIDDPPWG